MQGPCNTLEFLPPNATLLRIVFAAAPPHGSQSLPGFSDPLNAGIHAWKLPESAPPLDSELLCIQLTPHLPDQSDAHADDSHSLPHNIPDSLLLWCASAPAARGRGAAFAALHNAQLAWAPGRAVLCAEPDTLPLVTPALLEFAWLAAELESIESQLNPRWKELHADIPAAFHTPTLTPEQQSQLRERFCHAVAAKARLVQIAPLIESPPVYPPTIASQAGERLREKARLPERLEALREQLDTFTHVYEIAAQRLSETTASRSSLQLEWLIVVLLAFEVLLILVEILSRNST
ncbi:MAG: hypothetical protein RL215_818 [Planctomycetota bacterium]|jgi:hypothetical protein